MKKEVNFVDKNRNIIQEGGFKYKIRSFKNNEYVKVIVYAGRNIEKIAQRRSRKLLAWKDTKGKWQGDMDVVKRQGERGSAIYELDYHDSTESLRYIMYSDLEWNDDEKYAKNKLLKVLEIWNKNKSD